MVIIRYDKEPFIGTLTYFLYYKNNKKLKIDFNYYPFPLINKGVKYNDLKIDSLQDIAANKLHTILYEAMCSRLC